MAREYKGTGALFKNNYKKEDRHPDYKGEIEMGGLKYDLAAWLRESKNGNKYMSIIIGDLKDQRPEPLPEHPQENQPAANEYEDLPF